MKVNPELISLCQDYLDNPNGDTLKNLKTNTAYLEESDFKKAIDFLIKHNKVKTALQYQTSLTKFKSGDYKGYLNAENFYGNLLSQSTYHKRYNTRTEMKIELKEVFPEVKEIENAFDMVSQFTNLVGTKKRLEILTKITDEILTKNSLEETLNGWGEEEE